MITEFQAKNYGCLKAVSVPLSPLHALIGPNDSGKSTILAAVRTLAQLAGGKFDGERSPFDPRLPWEGRPTTPIVLRAKGSEGTYTYTLDKSGGAESAGRTAPLATGLRHISDHSVLRSDETLQATLRQLAGARLVRFDPNALRSRSGLVPESEAVAFLDDRGRGLPGIYQAILGRGDDAFRAVSDQFRGLFPTVRRLGVPAVTKGELTLEIELTDGTRIRAEHMSEGMLYFLAFAALPYLAPAAILLVEEPENGLHPSRIEDVMRILRETSKTTQVIIATHSPLVVNCLQSDEVTVVTRPSVETGTVTTPISKTAHFEKRSQIYALGELWLSYADGKVEAPLTEGIESEAAAGG